MAPWEHGMETDGQNHNPNISMGYLIMCLQYLWWQLQQLRMLNIISSLSSIHTNDVNHGAMKTWFSMNSYKGETTKVQNADEFTWHNASYALL